MAVVGNAVIKISAESAEFSKGTEQVKKKAHSFFDDLKHQYGRHSTLAQSLHLIAGTGAVAGIGLAAKEFGHFGEEVKKLSVEFAENNATAGEMADKIAASLPVIGHVYSGLKDIIGAMTGISAEVAEIEASAKINDQISAAMGMRSKAVQEFRGEINKLLDDLDHKTKGLNLKGASKDLFDSAYEYQKQREELQKKANDKTNGSDKDVAAINAELVEARKRLSGMPTKFAREGEAGATFDPYGAVTAMNQEAGVGTPEQERQRDELQSQIESLQEQRDRYKADIQAEAAKGVKGIDMAAAAEGMQHYKELIVEKVKAAWEAAEPIVKQMAARQEAAISNALDQFFSFEPQIDKALESMPREYQRAGAVEDRLGGRVVESDNSPADPMATMANISQKQLDAIHTGNQYALLTYQTLKAGNVPIVDIK